MADEAAASGTVVAKACNADDACIEVCAPAPVGLKRFLDVALFCSLQQRKQQQFVS